MTYTTAVHMSDWKPDKKHRLVARSLRLMRTASQAVRPAIDRSATHEMPHGPKTGSIGERCEHEWIDVRVTGPQST